MALISAHRGGAELRLENENKIETLQNATQMGVDFVEFDVQALKDGHFILAHDEWVIVNGKRKLYADLSLVEVRQINNEIVTLQQVLTLLAGNCKAHVDFKFDSSQAWWQEDTNCEARACQIIADYLPPEDFIVTSLDDASLLRVSQWANMAGNTSLRGLSLGKDTSGMTWIDKIKTRRSEIFPTSRLKACNANLIVANKKLARHFLARTAHRLSLPLLVWTVDDSEELSYWLTHPQTWLVTTNFPSKALALRDSV